MMRLFLYPSFEGEDNGEGGVRRVVEGQLKSLKRHGVTFVNEPGDADIIACHIDIPSEFVKRFPDKPLIVHNHGLYWSDYEWEEWSYKANRKALQSMAVADAITAPTEWVANVLRRHLSREVQVIPHGVSNRDWQPPVAPDSYVLWNKTRVDPVCDVGPLNAVARLLPDVQFVSTFGDPATNVRVTGRLPLPEAKNLIRNAGIYLATSRETFGVGTLEAMACGVPVVGYRFGGQAEYVEHEVSGYLVERGDVEGLARGIRWAQDTRATSGPAAREVASRFKWETAAVAYRDLYRNVLARYEGSESAPRTSIIVTAYNLERWLPDTLDSVQAQSDNNWECIVVDDASPDGCGAIADTYAATDERFKVIHNEKNQYLAASRNIGIDAARGRYILPLDADDMLPPRAVQTLADALDTDRTYQSVYGGVLFVTEEKQPVDYRVGLTLGHSGWPIEPDPMRQTMGANHQPYASMYRKSAWRQVGGYRTRLKTSEDADLWTRFASWGFRAAKVTDADMLIYRTRDDSMSVLNRANEKDYLRWFPWSRNTKLAPAGLVGERGISLMTPHLSVIIPVGPGHERYVQDAVDSVMAQSYPYWECIVVNDSGQDLLLPEWARVIRCDARDTATARNLGIAASRARLFLPLDADDFLQPDALQWLMSAFVESQGAIVYPDMYEDPKEAGVYTPYAFPDWSCEALRSRMIHSVTALYPKKAWTEVGGYTPNIQWEDWDFQLKCAEAGYCSARIAAPLFTYRKWTGTRRNYENEDELKTRLAAINARWGAYRTGEKHFMACNCSSKTVAPTKLSGPMNSSPERDTADAVRIQYVGGRTGNVRYRGTTGTIYVFAADGVARWVRRGDVEMFTRLRDFVQVGDNVVASGPVNSTTPVLVA